MNNVDTAATAAAEQTEATATVTAGALIAKAREEAGLTREELAQRMCMTPLKLEHLERDEFERLAGATYVRGYIRNTCKELGVDPQPVLEAFERQLPVQADSAPSARKPSGAVIAKGGQSSSGGFSGLVFVLALVAAGGGYWWFMQQPGAAAEAVQAAEVTSSSVVNDAQPEGEGAQEQEWSALEFSETGEMVSESEPDVISAGPDEDSASAEEGALDTDVELDVASEFDEAGEFGAASEVVAETEEVVLAESPVPAPAVPEQPVSEPAPAPDAALQAAFVGEVSEQEGAESRALAADAEALMLDFSEESWVEVTDASGNKLLAKLQPAGSRVELNGVAPFSLMLGNAAGTTVSYRGEVVESAPIGNRRTRKLTVGG